MTNQQTEYDRKATEYEEKAKLVIDPWVREKYLTLAKHCRETKRVPRRQEPRSRTAKRASGPESRERKREDGNMRRIGGIALAFLSSAVTAEAQDPQEGTKWATNVCGECHAIARSEPRSPNVRAPTFAELANTPGMTAAALNVALTTPHAGMPMFVLTLEQRRDISAYILSLKANR
jgi:mono/diheme cytochrome c family protein